MTIHRLLSAPLRAAAALTLVLLAVGSCDEPRTPTEPEEEAAAEATPQQDDGDVALASGPLVPVSCEVRVQEREMTCSPFDPGPEAIEAAPVPVIVGEQSTYVTLAASDISYDGSAGIFQADITVQNNMGQPYGTTDGTTVHADGIRVFHHSGPTVTGGSGSVSVANADGTATFTASGQSYFEYSELLLGGETSAPRNWKWNIPSTVTSFSFETYVSGEVQYPDGWVEVTPGAVGIVSDGSTTALTAQAKDVVGRDVSGRTYSWSTSNADVGLSSTSGTSVNVSSTTSGATSTITVTSDGTESNGTASVTVDGADLAVTELTAGPDPVGVGGTLQWTAELTNHGPTDVTAVHIEVKLTGSADLDHEDIVSTSGGVSCSTSFDNATFLTYDCDLGALTSGSSNDLTVHVNPRGATGVTIDAKVLSFTGATDNNAANDTRSRSLTVTSGANLEAGALTFTPAVPTTSQTVDIDGSITNTGDADAGAFDWRIVVDGTTVASGSESGLTAGSTLTSATVTASGLGPYALGGRKAQLIVDPADAVSEASETDNVTDGNLLAADSGFDIELRYLTTFTAGEKSLFRAAADRWESIITGDLADRTGDVGPTSDHPVVHGVDDLVIFVQEKDLGGVGGTLASAGPRIIRSTGKLSVTGVLTMDSNDFDDLQSSSEADEVILHEIGHVLGIGTLWDNLSLISGAGTSDPTFTGTEADAAFDAVGGETCYSGAVPVEQDGGSGTRDSHWDEGVLDTELMTGFAEADGVLEELSAITSESLEDLGYTINAASAEIDAYSVPTSPCGTRVPPRPGVAPAAHGGGEAFDEVLLPEFELTDDGRIVPIERP